MIKDKPDSATADEVGAENFLSRWSKRKRGVAAAPPAVDDGARPAAEAESEAPQPVAVAEPAPAADSESGAPPAVELPDLDSLDEHSDYRGFLSPDVDEKLQRLALRKLFATAGFNVRDGLDDYDDDMTVFEPLGDIVTADMRHQAEVEARREEARRLAAGEAADPESADTESADTEASDPETAEAPEPTESAGTDETIEPPLATEAGAAAATEPMASASAAEQPSSAAKGSEQDNLGVNRG